jgi:SAM-dependent methyltransferase
MPRYGAADVRRYYDRHTSAFVGLGQGRSTGAIHRAVWAPGVRNRRAAFHYVDDQIARLAHALLDGHYAPPTPAGEPAPLHVVDLGCGVGASLRYLAERLPMRGTGVTLSPVQADLATRFLAEAGLASRISCIEGDYCDLPADVSSADVAYAIESFVHTPSPEGFFDQCRRLVRQGGLLIICDDVRGESGTAKASKTIAEFCEGWHVNALLAPEQLRQLARDAGFAHESTHDLTPHLELGRPRDRAISLMLSTMTLLGLDVVRFDDLVGGRALQTCLRRGWIRYELAVFRRM